MSGIRIEHGTAEVIVQSDDFRYADGSVQVSYQADDLMAATIQALQAMPNDPGRYGEPTRATEWLRILKEHRP